MNSVVSLGTGTTYSGNIQFHKADSPDIFIFRSDQIFSPHVTQLSPKNKNKKSKY